ncbi:MULTISPECIES: SirB1 family protein [Thalassospira]|uniref:SirB1 family protein n=1 Tax=Thalassospira TaxID=168934 RepID=UPI000A62FB5F|nr:MULTISPECIES: transglutaminase-like domain-containing protein [Thalassospira]MCH2273467.1 transglutaminase-like domain-containing protein [Thalassospira sp.]
MLDRISDDVRDRIAALSEKAGADDQSHPSVDIIVQALQDIIPGTYQFQGDAENYDDIANADLMEVIDRKRGLPVALALLYIHAAKRCQIEVTGIDFPGHFLLRLQSGGARKMIDPFHGGITLGSAELRELLKAFQGLDAELQPGHYREASDIAILLRLQNNIKVRALRQGELALAARVIDSSLLIAPDHDGLWHQLGALYARLHEDEKALHAFTQFVGLCKDPMHRARISAVIEELRDRLGHGTSTQKKDSRNTTNSDALVQLYPVRPQNADHKYPSDTPDPSQP